MADNLEQQRDFYRQQCNDLGARLLHLQQEQSHARQEARRSRIATRLIRDLYHLADSQVSLEGIGQRFLQIILDTLLVQRAALLQYQPAEQRFVICQVLGFAAEQAGFVPPEFPPDYHFANAASHPSPLTECLRQVIGVPYFLWAFNPRADLALLLGNTVEDQHLHRPFEAGDQEMMEGALSVYIDIGERKRVETQMKASLEEKVVLLKEIHHRVKNNLQIMSSLLYLQSRSIQDSTTLEIFKESQNRIKSMALIHEKLYQSSDLARVDFAEYVHNLVHYLHHSYRTQASDIRIRINVAAIWLDLDTAIPCGLIINELMSNAFKYAFPGEVEPGREENREIGIDLHVEENGYGPPIPKLTLIVRDNGIGFPAELDFRDTTSLGLQLVNSLVNQLEGTIDLHRQGGTAFQIEFKPETLVKKSAV